MITLCLEDASVDDVLTGLEELHTNAEIDADEGRAIHLANLIDEIERQKTRQEST